MSDAPDVQQATFQHPDGTKFSIGDKGAHLQLTEERLEEARENQKRWEGQSTSPYLGVSPQMASYLRAVRELPNLLAQHEKNPTAILSQRIAESYATQGMLEDALVFAAPAYRAQYRLLAHAIERLDDEDCGPECDTKFEANPALLTKDTLAGWQFSPKHGKLMPVIRCAVCGSLNVKPLPEKLASQMDTRVKARELTQNSLTHSSAKDTLRQAGLTPDKVFT